MQTKRQREKEILKILKARSKRVCNGLSQNDLDFEMVTSSNFEVSITSIGYKVMDNYSRKYPDTMIEIFLIKLLTECACFI